MWNLELLPLLRDLQGHLDEKLTVSRLARRAGQSRSHFGRYFRRVLGESPRRYIERLRLEQAAARLLASRDSVFRIALRAGFSSHEVFIRAFRRKFGCAPLRSAALSLSGDAPCLARNAPASLATNI
jgi:AraC-like DNA-binding protein